ncbi:uncharacterized protein LOC110973697 [Acanthaster planci]|uniref:Uncharacterized protein LOC110973697 n=1 Tax=Acanthaster planci TaxID=133434 RepID=A0A8B7XKB3_ACAPL|nr:uncharacterized protein LOC110973697 [Acanthaster planci]
MLSSFIVCVLVVSAGAMAVKKPVLNAQTVFGISPREGEDERKPCATPKYFTFDQADFMTTLEEGRLTVEYVNFHGAYDEVLKRYSVETFLDFFNGTLLHLKVIAEYDEGKGYLVQRLGDEIECEVYDLEGKKFPEEFSFPEDATFLADSTLGDRDLTVESWYYVSEDGTKHNVKTVTKDECVPVSLFSRKFDPETGEELEVVNGQVINFKLGICDPESYFKIPEECKEVGVSKELSKNMKKMHRFGLM